MFPLLREPFLQLTSKQSLVFPPDLTDYFEQFNSSKEHIELIIFTVQTMILQNDRFSELNGEELVIKLGVAAKYFSVTIQVVENLIQADPTWYQPWLIRIAPELEAHAKSSQVVYTHFSHLAEAPLHMGGWSIYAIVKGVEAALDISPPPSWETMHSFPPGSDEVLIIEFMSQLILRFLEYHRSESRV